MSLIKKLSELRTLVESFEPKDEINELEESDDGHEYEVKASTSGEVYSSHPTRGEASKAKDKYWKDNKDSYIVKVKKKVAESVEDIQETKSLNENDALNKLKSHYNIKTNGDSTIIQHKSENDFPYKIKSDNGVHTLSKGFSARINIPIKFNQIKKSNNIEDLHNHIIKQHNKTSKNIPHLFTKIEESEKSRISLLEAIQETHASTDNFIRPKSVNEKSIHAIYEYYKDLSSLTNEILDEDFKTIPSTLLDDVSKATVKMYLKQVIKSK